MRVPAALVAAAAVCTAAVAPSASASGSAGLGSSSVATAPSTTATRTLTKALSTGMRQAGDYSGAYVVDLTSSQLLFSSKANVPRLPASVEKLYTTTTALERFGPDAQLNTTIRATGTQTGSTYTGSLYLQGAGDPTFGSSTFAHANYGTGSTVQQLVAGLKSRGIRTIKGAIVADETVLDSVRGTPATGGKGSYWVEGDLSGLVFDRDWANDEGTVFYSHPALHAGAELVSALRAGGISVPRNMRVTAGTTPSTAATLATSPSPPMSTLIALTNTPSDNFFAEMLLKDIGARFGTGGTTASGASVVRAEMSTAFGITPQLNDGSGLSRSDHTTPRQVVTLLAKMASDTDFTDSLAVAGRTGTLVDEMRGTIAQGRCRGKTGTLTDASNLVGYCQASDGDTIAFAFLMNGVNPDAAHPIQDRMAEALVRYDG